MKKDFTAQSGFIYLQPGKSIILPDSDAAFIVPGTVVQVYCLN